MRNLIEWQARATLTREALAAVRAMAPPEDGRDISRDLALEAVIIAMAKRGEIADAFALTRSLQRGRSSTFLRIFEVLAGLD
jgi:tRNA threonylcarbamoyladenosine modification (KEOPS) complex Cgi121 subunit